MRLAQELVRLRYEADGLEFDAALRHLQARGFDPAMLALLEQDARRAGVSAPFLQATGERARDLWRQAFDLLMQLESLERAVEAAARDLDRDRDSSTLVSLKTERDTCASPSTATGRTPRRPPRRSCRTSQRRSRAWKMRVTVIHVSPVV